MLTLEQHRCSNEKGNFSAEFKRESTQLVVNQNFTVAGTIQSYGCRSFHNDKISQTTAWWASEQNTKSLSDDTRTNRNTWAEEKAATYWNREWNIRKGYGALDVRLPKQFSIIEKLRAHYLVIALCHVCRIHRSSYRDWKNRPEKDGRRAVLRSQVIELNGGARNIATIATRRDYQMGRKLAGSLMKEQGLVSCQPLTLRYRHGSHELVAILRTWRALSCDTAKSSMVTWPISGLVNDGDTAYARAISGLPPFSIQNSAE